MVPCLRRILRFLEPVDGAPPACSERTLLSHFEGGALRVSSLAPMHRTPELGSRTHLSAPVGRICPEQWAQSGQWTPQQLDAMKQRFSRPVTLEAGRGCAYLTVLAEVSTVAGAQTR